MAYIDLKNVHFYIQDGYQKVGAVGTGGAAQNATTVPISGLPSNTKIDAGVPVVFGSAPTKSYVVVSTTETSGTTTSIVVSPALAASLTAADTATFGPHFIEVVIGEGNLTYSEKVPREYKKNRGLLDQVRNGDQEPMDVSFGFAYDYLSSATGANTPTVEEFFQQAGPAAGYITTGKDCEPFAVNLVMVNQVPTCGTEQYPVEKTTLPQFRYEDLAHDPKAGTVTATGKCNALKAIKQRLAS